MTTSIRESGDGKNYGKFENIVSAVKEALPGFDIRRLKPYLWRDEISDIFLLTKKSEICLWNRYTLNFYCWSVYTYKRIKKTGLMIDEPENGSDDNGIFQFKSDIKNLPALLKICGEVKCRMKRNSYKRKRLEKLLGHKILRCQLDGNTWKGIQMKDAYGKNPFKQPQIDCLAGMV